MKKCIIFFALFLLLLTHSAMAAKVTIVKNNKVMLALEGESLAPGAQLYIINEQGKKVAIVQLTQVKGDKAVGQILKGSAKVGHTTQAKGGTTAAAGAAGTEDYYNNKLNQRAHTGNSYGIVGGYLMNNMTINASGLNTTMSGSGFGALGYFDYALSSSFVGRAMVGMEQYAVAGSNTATSPVNCTADCDVKLTYLSMYGYARWNFLQGNYKSWLGGGVGYLYPTGKASTAFKNSSQLQANQIFVLSAGMDIRLSAKTYIPVSLEYGLFPSSPTVTANIIFLRAGYAWNL